MEKEKTIHRQIMESEINNQICSLCGETHLMIVIHHQNGERKNNSKKNLLPVCDYCHYKIHKGLSKKDYNKDLDWKMKIFYFRKIWLKGKYNLDNESLNKKLNLESLKASKKYFHIYIQKNVCYSCRKKGKLIYAYPSYLKEIEFHNLDKKKFSIPFCEICFKRFKDHFKGEIFSTL